MEEKILDIITECKLGEITTNEATRQVLYLFAVSGSLPIFKCKCGYETSNSTAWCVHADCCNGNDR